MSIVLSRRDTLRTSAAAFTGVSLSALLPAAAAQAKTIDSPPSSFPSQDPALVREIVGVSHRDIDRVREILRAAPRLANCAYDGGFGDWETPLGAASHTGRIEIARLLLEHGARPDIFAMAMLGAVEAVAGMLKANPDLARMRGPHGLTLMHHARAGGDGAQAVADLLATVPGADEPYPVTPLADRTPYVGAYRFGPGPDEVVEVVLETKDESLSIRRKGGSSRRLFHLGEHRFHPAGAPDTSIAFTMDASRATRITITTPAPLIEASRE